jgi:hypothetical protein
MSGTLETLSPFKKQWIRGAVAALRLRHAKGKNLDLSDQQLTYGLAAELADVPDEIVATVPPAFGPVGRIDWNLRPACGLAADGVPMGIGASPFRPGDLESMEPAKALEAGRQDARMELRVACVRRGDGNNERAVMGGRIDPLFVNPETPAEAASREVFEESEETLRFPAAVPDSPQFDAFHRVTTLNARDPRGPMLTHVNAAVVRRDPTTDALPFFLAGDDTMPGSQAWMLAEEFLLLALKEPDQVYGAHGDVVAACVQWLGSFGRFGMRQTGDPYFLELASEAARLDPLAVQVLEQGHRIASTTVHLPLITKTFPIEGPMA